MVVTRIERQKRHPGRVNLYIDDEYALGLHEDVLFKFGLRKGDKLNVETLDALKSTEEFHLAKERALRFLSYCARSEKELRAKLREKEFHPAAIESAISSLREQGIVNDKSFASAYVKDMLIRKPAGKALLRRQLRSKGIDSETIRDVLNDMVTHCDEDSLALDVASKLLNRIRTSRKKIDMEKQRARITSFLARRGFEWTTINTVLSELSKLETQNSKLEP
jgi:regulatory protein